MSISVFPSAGHLPQKTFLTDCAVSGGTLEAFLKSALQLAQGQLCVRIRPIHMDFILPCFSGAGTSLTEPQARELRIGRRLFFSSALCTEYFTFFQQNQLHGVLSDTSETLVKKYHLARQLNIPYVLAEDPAVFSLLIAQNI